MRPIRVALAVAAAACLLPTSSSALDGTQIFVDVKILVRSQARAEALGVDFQVDGFVEQQDATVNPNRAVQFCYQASGTADKSDADGTKGTFSSVDLTLVIVDLFPISAPPGPTVIYQETITHPCKLKAAVKKAGAQISSRLSCQLGDALSAFPGLTPDLLDSIAEAYRERKSTRINAKSGKLGFRLKGVPTPEGVIPLEPCDVLFPPPAPPAPAVEVE